MRRLSLSCLAVLLSSPVLAATDEPPVARIVSPRPEDRMPATWVPFACECIDDVGCARAEFLLDGALLATQEGPGPVYSVRDWDTTKLASGTHVFQAIVTDTAGQEVITKAVTVCIGCPEPDAGTPVDGGSAVDGGSTVDAGGFVSQDEGDDILDPWSCGCGTTALAPAAWMGLGVLGLRARRRRA